MKYLLLCVVSLLAASYSANAGLVPGFRPPAVPLITYDPYLSVWSMASNLTDSWPRLWDGTTKAFTGIIRVDGASFRFMGDSSGGSPAGIAHQLSVTVYPTRTVYVFEQAGVKLTLTFTTPLLPSSLEMLSRPVTYITYNVMSTDARQHSVQLYYDNTAEIAVDQVTEQVTWQRSNTGGGLRTMRIGTSAQPVMQKTGDGVGINWGYLYVAAENNGIQQSMANCQDARGGFVSNGKLPGDNTNMPTPANNNWPVLAVAWDLGSVGAQNVERVLLVAYDDIFSINYFGVKLQAYWRQLYGGDILRMLDQAWKDYSGVMNAAQQFDEQLIAKLSAAGGDEYATIASLSYRQTLAGTKMTWHPDLKHPWYFMKEISSDGDVSTVDVIFPASPLFLYFSPDLLALQLIPVLEYANNATPNHYNLAWAPHHLGTWPVANIQTNQQENMPIEETANMLMMLAALEHRKSKVDLSAYWKIYVQWADYLISALPDPENQLCTDDFEGPIPHDSNLALKGILGISSFAQMCQNRGNTTCYDYYMKVATGFAAKWVTLSNPDNSNHYRLRYDQPGWSLKYNMLFQYILGQKVFNQSVIDMEIAFYKTNLHAFGIPLDLRSDYTKLDWQSWIAAMGTDADFKTILHAIYRFANETPDRVPLSDWYFTSTAKQRGFQARTVVGGVYAKMIV
jgi:hypothetical protein